LPVIDSIAGDYLDEVAFVAVAGRSSFDRTAAEAERLFSENLRWGLDESIWDLYGVFGQPYTVLISGDDRQVDAWFGLRAEDDIRASLDELVAAGI